MKSTSSKMSRLLDSAKKSNSIMAILKKPSDFMQQMKKKNVVFQRNDIGLDFTKTTKITDWKKDSLINEILEGKMSQRACQFHEQIMRQSRYSLQSLIN